MVGPVLVVLEVKLKIGAGLLYLLGIDLNLLGPKAQPLVGLGVRRCSSTGGGLSWLNYDEE